MLNEVFDKLFKCFQTFFIAQSCKYKVLLFCNLLFLFFCFFVSFLCMLAMMVLLLLCFVSKYLMLFLNSLCVYSSFFRIGSLHFSIFFFFFFFFEVRFRVKWQGPLFKGNSYYAQNWVSVSFLDPKSKLLNFSLNLLLKFWQTRWWQMTDMKKWIKMTVLDF